MGCRTLKEIRNMKDCTTCKYGYEDERLGILMCHHPKRFSDDCVDFNMHEEKMNKEITNDLLESKPTRAVQLSDGRYVTEELARQMAHEGLDEAAKEYTDTRSWAKDNYLTPYIRDAFKAGAEWQKEQKPELIQHPPITYTYPSDASRDERLKRAIIALLNSDLIKVAGNKFTKQDLIDWVEKQKPAEDEK